MCFTSSSFSFPRGQSGVLLALNTKGSWKPNKKLSSWLCPLGLLFSPPRNYFFIKNVLLGKENVLLGSWPSVSYLHNEKWSISSAMWQVISLRVAYYMLQTKDFESCRMPEPLVRSVNSQRLQWGKSSQDRLLLYTWSIFVDVILVNFSSISKCFTVYAADKEKFF